MLSNLEKQNIANRLDEAEELRMEIALRNPWFFCVNYVYTLDEHDEDNPIKKFPAYRYLEEITKVWATEKLVVIGKTRQMFITWLLSSLNLWLSLQPGKKIFYQSKKEEDACSILDRTKISYKRLPARLQWGCVPAGFDRDLSKRPTKNDIRDIYNKLEFPWLDSSIQAIPQGPEIIRMHTVSSIFCDEMAFQDQVGKALAAAKPTIDGGGRFTGVSTPNGQ